MFDQSRRELWHWLGPSLRKRVAIFIINIYSPFLAWLSVLAYFVITTLLVGEILTLLLSWQTDFLLGVHFRLSNQEQCLRCDVERRESVVAVLYLDMI